MSRLTTGALFLLRPQNKNLRDRGTGCWSGVHGNTYVKNGGGKLGSRFTAFGLTKGADLFWSGKGNGNGWSEKGVTSFPENLPAFGGGIVGGGGR